PTGRGGDWRRKKPFPGGVSRSSLLCGALPIGGLLLGLFSLKELGGSVPAAELFRPLIVGTAGPLAVLVLAALTCRHARLALDTWEEKALQLSQFDQAGQGVSLTPPPTP